MSNPLPNCDGGQRSTPTVNGVLKCGRGGLFYVQSRYAPMLSQRFAALNTMRSLVSWGQIDGFHGFEGEGLNGHFKPLVRIVYRVCSPIAHGQIMLGRVVPASILG
jgi:hypothetical protein